MYFVEERVYQLSTELTSVSVYASVSGDRKASVLAEYIDGMSILD